LSNRRDNTALRLVRRLTPYARTPDKRPLGRAELRLIDDNFETDNYFSELFIDDEINVSSTNATYGESHTATFCYRCNS
jgi:hypothetical protein